jgi:hypothetical protein
MDTPQSDLNARAAVADSGEPMVIFRIGTGQPVFVIQSPERGIGCIGQWFVSLQRFYNEHEE